MTTGATAELVLLGSGGWIPTDRRETCCAIVRNGAHALVIDAGTGLRRLCWDSELLDGVTSLDLLLTHFHLDHVTGLGFAPALPLRPRIWGPGALLYGEPTVDVIGRLLASPLFSGPLDAVCTAAEDVPEGGLDIGGLDVRVRVQERHSAPTLAVRIGDFVCYCTDTAADPGNADFARGSQLLCHDAWFTAERPADVDFHTSGAEAGELAAEAGVDELILIHLPPAPALADEVAAEARAAFGRTTPGSDGLRRRAGAASA